MSSTRSTTNGEGIPSSKCGTRSPLRSLENGVLHPSTLSSRFKSKSLLNADVVKTKKQEDVPLPDPEHNLQSPPSIEVIGSNAPTVDVTALETQLGLGDVTFKSFVCAGGEVEIEGSVCREESIILPKEEQATNITCETEDIIISDSMIVESCGDHVEHPYYDPETKEAPSVDPDTACPCDVSNATPALEGERDEECTAQATQNDVTWKSFVCDGGEVEVSSDATRLPDETIPLPNEQLGVRLQDDGANSTSLSDCSQLCQVVDDTDHLYCSRESEAPGVVTDSPETARGLEKPADVTFRSFYCTGGEIEVSDGTEIAGETVPLPVDQTATCSYSYDLDMNPSMCTSDQDDVQTGHDYLDHPYCKAEKYPSTPSGDIPSTQEPLPSSLNTVDEVKQISLSVPDGQIVRKENITTDSSSSVSDESEKSVSSRLSQKISSLLDDEALICQSSHVDGLPVSGTQGQIQPNSHVENHDGLDAGVTDIATSSPANTSGKASDDKSLQCQMQEKSEKFSTHSEDSALPSMLHRTESSDWGHLAASAQTPKPAAVHSEKASPAQLGGGPHGSRQAKDSALGSSGSEPAPCNSGEKSPAETFSDAFKALSECPSVASALQFAFFSPVVKRASQFLLQAQKDRAPSDQFWADDFLLDGEKSFVAPVDGGLWEHLETAMPRPLFNSTVLGPKPQPNEPLEDVVVAEPSVPLIPDGPLQQQLRQMAEFLFLASGKMGPAPFMPPAAAAVTAPPTEAPPPTVSHSVCVGTTPVKWAEHSVNTSGQFERKREFAVVDSCTLTDPLLWNVPPGSLESLPRRELEQRLRSSMIMVEALVQQLAAAASAPGCPPAAPPPSDLREKQVQTDHTELSQTSMHRELYLEAVSRIGELELDASSLQNLTQRLQDTRLTLTSLSNDTDAGLSTMKRMGDDIREDHQVLASHYGQMRSLLRRTKEQQTKMMQKVRDALQQRADMKTHMEEASTAKEAALGAMEQLRTHCAAEVSELQKALGSQEELRAALDHTYPQLVTLNKACTESLDSVSDVLSTTLEEQASLMKELCRVRGLLKRTSPVLLKLSEKAADALRERDQHMAARNQAVEERDQIAEECNQANLNLQTAGEEIGDLNLQVKILSTEMGVLRQKLSDRDEERAQLERKVTELSATVSSTMASYAFLEQALAAETTGLQQSWKDIQQAKDRANELEGSLGQSEQRAWELTEALAQSEERLAQTLALSQSQAVHIKQLQDACKQLGGVQEMNEFLQMENELAREQMAESESLLKANLQGLRERNIQCEDLKLELGQLQLENRSVREELDTTRAKAGTTQLELREELAEAVTEITLLHHTLRGLTNQLLKALDEKTTEPQRERESPQAPSRRHPSSSFVDSVMVALTTEKDQEDNTETVPADEPEPQADALFSETSAFTRIAALPPKEGVTAAGRSKRHEEEEQQEEEEQISVAELLSGLSSTVTELVDTLNALRQRKDAQLEQMHNTICGLQEEQQASSSTHQAQVCELQHQLSRLNGLVERGSQALQQKAQDEKTVTKLRSEIQETQETLNKHVADSNEHKKEVLELRSSLRQAEVETEFLRRECEKKAGGQSTPPAHLMEEKIYLLKEVERLKFSLQEVEMARVKLLERAKRHQIIYQTNQQKSENELQMLSNMISRVRETLLSLPAVVNNCDQLQRLVEYIG